MTEVQVEHPADLPGDDLVARLEGLRGWGRWLCEVELLPQIEVTDAEHADLPPTCGC